MFELGDRVRLIDSPNEDVIPINTEGIVVGTEVEYYIDWEMPEDEHGDVWVKFDGYAPPPADEIYADYSDNCPMYGAMDCRNEELVLVVITEDK